MSGPHQLIPYLYSTFGLAFEEAAEKTGARISFDSFETSVVQVHDGDIEHFVETLYYKAR
jgi:cell division control protein 45